MDIRYEPDNHRVAAYEDAKEVGEAIYREAEDIWVLDCTCVDEPNKGRGIGGELVVALAGEARKRGVKIIPLCPYAKRVFDTDASYADVRKH
ncbi:Uncharacterised protein [Aedoeadaptatus ivorii]|uniref:Uncharacterized protein n=1 Tax=Aedoeadaptatus ivorii TaxID=54006 RepID=A0A448V3G9_9FIRM|nr:GNAT family N-acetyltransferase [Peptoniphilus ivorii]MDQ0508342.1 putative GNAT family acetyltransferase [Peptoniphilus ivorii]VEJ36317.1 Uncharacterised protein [Peptoniphilus ivorii]